MRYSILEWIQRSSYSTGCLSDACPRDTYWRRKISHYRVGEGKLLFPCLRGSANIFWPPVYTIYYWFRLRFEYLKCWIRYLLGASDTRTPALIVPHASRTPLTSTTKLVFYFFHVKLSPMRLYRQVWDTLCMYFREEMI